MDLLWHGANLNIFAGREFWRQRPSWSFDKLTSASKMNIALLPDFGGRRAALANNAKIPEIYARQYSNASCAFWDLELLFAVLKVSKHGKGIERARSFAKIVLQNLIEGLQQERHACLMLAYDDNG
jgi:hypothetical protein